MLQDIIIWFLNLSPKTKRFFWRFWYDLFAKKSKNQNLTFMNYGFAEEGMLSDFSGNQHEVLSAQLYHHIATQVDINNKKVLEVGSGRGGGAFYIHSSLNTHSVTGLDISKEGTSLAKNLYNVPGLSFVQGDSESLPFQNKTFDIVINIESSHCYGNINQFVGEVYRVLTKKGVFLWCDFRTKVDMQKLFYIFKSSGFSIIKEKNITKNIVNSLALLTPYRSMQIKKHIPKPLQRVFKSYSGVSGSDMYNAFLSERIIYKSAALKKL